MGIYVIRNMLTGHCYIGRAYDLKRRWAKHRQDLVWQGYLLAWPPR